MILIREIIPGTANYSRCLTSPMTRVWLMSLRRGRSPASVPLLSLDQFWNVSLVEGATRSGPSSKTSNDRRTSIPDRGGTPLCASGNASAGSVTAIDARLDRAAPACPGSRRHANAVCGVTPKARVHTRTTLRQKRTSTFLRHSWHRQVSRPLMPAVARHAHAGMRGTPGQSRACQARLAGY